MIHTTEQTKLPNLLQLPDEVLAKVVKYSSYGSAILHSCRGLREAVLSFTEHVIFRPRWDSTIQLQPEARLLHKACTTARSAGELRLTLDLAAVTGNLDAWFQLLEPGVLSGGWRQVHVLEVCSPINSGLHLIAPAFPSLRILTLSGSDLDGSLFWALINCPHLSELHLRTCVVKQAAVATSAAAIATLPSLTKVSLLEGTYIGLLQHTTSLTYLSLSWYQDLDLALQIAAQNPHLVEFHLKEDSIEIASEIAGIDVDEQQLCDLLSACPELTELVIEAGVLNQWCLEALVEHGTHITHLTVKGFELVSPPKGECQWSHLRVVGNLEDGWPLTVTDLAFLPLKTVQRFEVWNSARREWCGTTSMSHLVLAGTSGPEFVSSLREVVYAAAQNISTCPAWVMSKPSGFELEMSGDYHVTIEEHAPLLEALAPLRGSDFTHLVLSGAFHLGQPEVAALQRSFGGSVTTMTLEGCTVLPTFWAELHGSMTSVSTLEIRHPCFGISGTNLTVFCASRAPAHPLTLKVHAVLYDTCEAQKVQAALESQGLHHLNLIRMVFP